MCAYVNRNVYWRKYETLIKLLTLCLTSECSPITLCVSNFKWAFVHCATWNSIKWLITPLWSCCCCVCRWAARRRRWRRRRSTATARRRRRCPRTCTTTPTVSSRCSRNPNSWYVYAFVRLSRNHACAHAKSCAASVICYSINFKMIANGLFQSE